MIPFERVQNCTFGVNAILSFSESVMDLYFRDLFNQCFGTGFFPDPNRTFFPESGSWSAQNPDPIRKILVRIHEKNVLKLEAHVEIFIYFIFSTLKTVLLVRGLQNLIKEHQLHPIGLLMDGSEFWSPDQRNNPDPSGSRSETLSLTLSLNRHPPLSSLPEFIRSTKTGWLIDWLCWGEGDEKCNTQNYRF